MEANSMREEMIAKIRKPYTITKQRERWTVEEHNRFLEALKLYGRAWQRIEEHIGTKTAVQIRSHAQKFFTKLEKEALMKGIPPGQAHDIDIPPPRPKRKPSNPYPRKTTVGSLSPTREAVNDKPSKSVSLMNGIKQVLDVETHASQEKLAATKTFQRKEISENGSCSEVLNLFQDTPSASISSVENRSPFPCPTSCMNRELILAMKEEKGKCGMDKSSVYVLENERIKEGTNFLDEDGGGIKEVPINPQGNFAQEVGTDVSKLQKTVTSNAKENVQGDQPDPNYAPAQFRGGSSANHLQTTSFDEYIPTAETDQVVGHANANPFIDPTASATPKLHHNSAMPCMNQPFPAFPPFTQFHNDQDAYRSLLNISSTFSSLIISTLLQNPAVHAAASLAASFWPSGVDTPVDSSAEVLFGGVPVRHMNPSPSMASIAAATVAAAAAWWATQGLLPLPPPHVGFAFAPAPTATVSTMYATQASELMSAEKEGPKEGPFQNTWKDQQAVNSDQCATQKTCHTSKLSLSSTSDSDESRSVEPLNCTEPKTSRTSKVKSLSAVGLDDSDEVRSKKKLERSSCGSNTPSGSEVETDAILEKHEQDSNEATQAHFGNFSSTVETTNRRIRYTAAGMNESWKEVSNEGRLAFQALFSREVLPQKFSQPHSEVATAKTGEEDKAAPTLTVKLPFFANDKACAAADLSHTDGFTKESSETCSENLTISLLTSETGHGKLKTRRIGFKPYKRCSVEAKENKGTAGEEVCNKRIRLEGESST